MDILSIFSAFGLSVSTGLNAYIPLLVVALLAKFTTLIHLSEPWDALTSWWTIGILIALSIVEFFADKVPAVNHVNDAIQTIVRPAAGAIIFAASARVITDVHPVLAIVLGLLVSGSVHAVKSIAVRPAVSAATGGVGNIPVSILEDAVSTITSIMAVVVPVFFAILFLFLAGLIAWFFLFRRRKTVRV